MALNAGEDAPDFHIDSTQGLVDFHAWKGSSWAVMLCCPFAFTPVCTTELVALARKQSAFAARRAKLLVSCIDTLAPVQTWMRDIATLADHAVTYPIIADEHRDIATAYRMIAPGAGILPVAPGRWLKPSPDFANRTLFLITPEHRVACAVTHQPNVGIDVGEVLRLLDRLQGAA